MALRVTRQGLDVLGAADGALRVTRQGLDVLGGADGALRVTRQSVEVLGRPEIIIEESIEHPLGLSQLITRFVTVTVVDILGISDAVIGQATHVTSDVLGVSDAAVFTVNWRRSVTQALGIVHTNDYRGPVYQQVQATLHFDDKIGRSNVRNLSVSDVIAFDRSLGRVLEQTVTSTLALVAECERTNICISTLVFVQTATAGTARATSHDLTLTQTAEVAGIYLRSVTDTLELTHAGTYTLENTACLTRQYHPFVGFNTDDATTPPPATHADLGIATMTLTYPYVTPTLTVVLRNPEFGNRDSLMFNRVNRQTRGGTLVVYADSTWPKIQTLQVQVRGLSSQQNADMHTFFSQSLGKEIGLLDHENRQWHGIITDPDAAISQPGRQDYTVSFTFEGAL
jgi:hypothetical protein